MYDRWKLFKKGIWNRYNLYLDASNYFRGIQALSGEVSITLKNKVKGGDTGGGGEE